MVLVTSSIHSGVMIVATRQAKFVSTTLTLKKQTRAILWGPRSSFLLIRRRMKFRGISRGPFIRLKIRV